MEGVNKLISVFLLLVVVGFVLWLLMTKISSVKNFFASKFPSFGIVATQEAKLTNTNKPKSDLLSGIEQNFQQGKVGGSTTNKAVLGDQNENNKLPSSNVVTYPKTGAESIVIMPFIAMIYAGGKLLKKLAI